MKLYFRDQVASLAEPLAAAGDLPSEPRHDALRAVLEQRGACFWTELNAALADSTEAEALIALYDLVWSGEVTNDSLSPLRAGRPSGPSSSASVKARRPRVGRLTRLGPPAAAGRWSLVAPLLEGTESATAAAMTRAMALLERYGVVTREGVNAEGVTGGFTSVYGVLKVLEERGRVRRGYFVDGLGAAQFSLPGAVDRLRHEREPSADATPPVVLCAADPAQLYGSALAWPDHVGRPQRVATAVVVSWRGVALAWFDRSSKQVVTFGSPDLLSMWIDALARLGDLEIRRIDDQPITSSPLADGLRALGLRDGYRGLILPKR